MPRSAHARDIVGFSGPYMPGTVVVKTSERSLYYVLGNSQAVRYPVGVGRAGKQWSGTAMINGKYLHPAWTPPAALARFLAAGDAPVYIGFGSMTGFDNARLLNALIDAMQGRRALFHPGWSGIDPKALPENFFVVGDTPHDWLLPRTAAVIHHGGSGTSHSATRAGVPSIVTPFAGDQFFWAECLRQAGVAPAAVDGRKPNAQAFANALDFAASETVRSRARALGATMRAENGVANAVAALERIVAVDVREGA